MNILFRMEKGIAVCLFSSFFVLACVNHIPGEKAAVSNGDIPLKFTADIHEVTYTRVAGNGFEENDEVGVFALVGSSTMKEERYADNLRFFRTSEKVFESSEPIYYPDDQLLSFSGRGREYGRKYDVGGGRNRSKSFCRLFLL